MYINAYLLFGSLLVIAILIRWLVLGHLNSKKLLSIREKEFDQLRIIHNELALQFSHVCNAIVKHDDSIKDRMIKALDTAEAAAEKMHKK